MPVTNWDVRRLPRQHGKTFLVTGASAGIGYFVAEQLASTGAAIILAARDESKANRAVDAIRARVPAAQLRFLKLDLGDLGTVQSAADEVSAAPRLDGAVLNAGVLSRAEREETVGGHELLYGTNYLGHFVLAALLYPKLEMTGQSRIVTMGSVAARWARPRLDDPESRLEPYRTFRTYMWSKLAQSIFAFELDRRLRAVGSSVSSLVAHPGGALDGLTPSRPPLFDPPRYERLQALPRAPFAQGKERAAWPAVRALLDPEARGGQLWGPRFLKANGRPTLERPSCVMTDHETGAQLWSSSEDATTTAWPLTDAQR